MKKTLCISIMCLLISPMAMATGFYAGAGVGAIYLKTKLSTSNSFTSDHVTASVDTEAFSTKTAFNSALLLGYAHTFKNKSYVAIEAFANFPSIKSDEVASDAYALNDSSLSFNSVYGLRLLPGYQVTPATVVYGIIGYALADVHTESTLTGTMASVPALNLSSSSDEKLNGYQLGLGAMTKLSQHVSVRADAIYSTYEHTNPVVASSSGGDLTNTYQQTPYTIETDVSLIYQFG